MKKALLLLLALCFAQSGWCQLKPVVYAGLQHQLSLHRLTLRLSAAPMAGIQHKRHFLGGGPVILIKEFSADTDNFPRLSGGQLSYQYLLTARDDKKLRIYTELISKAQIFKENWQSNYWDESLQQYQDTKQESRELLVENYAGIGMRYQLLSRLHLQTSAALGYWFSDLQRKGNSFSSTENKLDYRPYDNQDLCYAIHMGVYYKLKK